MAKILSMYVVKLVHGLFRLRYVVIEGGYSVIKIIHNKIRCLKCGDEIESHDVHDFKFCSCGACAVDDGHDYLKRCDNGSHEDWEELSEIEVIPEQK